MISAHYGMSNEFDNLIVSLCKFTTLLSSNEVKQQLYILNHNNLPENYLLIDSS